MKRSFWLAPVLTLLLYWPNFQVLAQPQIELINRHQIADSYAFGDTVLLEWTTSSPLLPVTIDYSVDGGKRWKNIATVKGKMSYNWAVPSIASREYRLRLSLSDTSFRWNVVDTLSQGNSGVVNAHFVDDTTLVTLSGLGNVDDTLRVWDMKAGQEIMAAPVLANGDAQPSSNASLVAVSNSSRLLVSGVYGVEGCQVRSLSDKTVIESLPGTMSPMTSRRIFDDKFRPNHESILTLKIFGPSEWLISEYEIDPLANVLNLSPWFPENSIDFVSFLPSGRILAGYKKSLVTNNKCYMYDGYTGELLAETYKDIAALDVWYSEDGEKIAIPAKDGGTFILNSEDLGIIRQIQTHSGNIYRSAFSPDGKYLVILAGTAKMYDVPLSRSVGLQALPSIISEVAFSPDSRLAIFGYQNGDLAVFDVINGDLVWHKPGVHLGIVSDIVFSPNREYAVTTSDDGIAYVWRTSIATDYTYTDLTVQAPVVRTVPIVFGTVPPGEPEQMTLTALYNESAIDLEVQSHILHGPSFVEFELMAGGAPFILKARDSHQITVRFTPLNSDYKRAWIEFAVQHRYIPSIVDLYGNIQTSSVGLYFDQITESGTPQVSAAIRAGNELSLFYSGQDRIFVGLGVYDLLGRQIFKSDAEIRAKSWNYLQLEKPVAPGCYLLHLKSESFEATMPIFYKEI